MKYLISFILHEIHENKKIIKGPNRLLIYGAIGLSEYG